MKPHVQTWKLIHKTENGSGQGTGRASDLLRGEVAARPGWKPDRELGDSNGTWTVPRADGVDPHAGSQLTARGDPLKHPAARNRESSRSAGPSRAGQLRAPAAQEGAVTLRTPRPRRRHAQGTQMVLQPQGAVVLSPPPPNTPFLGPHFQTAGGGVAPTPRGPRSPQPSRLPRCEQCHRVRCTRSRSALPRGGGMACRQPRAPRPATATAPGPLSYWLRARLEILIVFS